MKKTTEREKMRALLKRIPRSSFLGSEVGTPWGTMREINEDFVKNKLAALRNKYPKYKFRHIQCHEKSHTYEAITIDNPDHREYVYMSERGTWDSEGYYTRFDEEESK